MEGGVLVDEMNVRIESELFKRQPRSGAVKPEEAVHRRIAIYYVYRGRIYIMLKGPLFLRDILCRRKGKEWKGGGY